MYIQLRDFRNVLGKTESWKASIRTVIYLQIEYHFGKLKTGLPINLTWGGAGRVDVWRWRFHLRYSRSGLGREDKWPVPGSLNVDSKPLSVREACDPPNASLRTLCTWKHKKFSSLPFDSLEVNSNWKEFAKRIRPTNIIDSYKNINFNKVNQNFNVFNHNSTHFVYNENKKLYQGKLFVKFYFNHKSETNERKFYTYSPFESVFRWRNEGMQSWWSLQG